jgi:hypothetical protein
MTGVKQDGALDPERSGGNVNYYLVEIPAPKRLAAYTAEAEDIIEALGMTFAEGCAFKAIWRSCAARALGKFKVGMDEHGIYDAEKVEYYGGRMVAVRKAAMKVLKNLEYGKLGSPSLPPVTEQRPVRPTSQRYRTKGNSNE